MKHFPVFVVAFLAALLALPEFAAACPNCKEAVMEGGTDPISAGYNASIIFLMVVPFLVLTFITVRIAISARKSRGAQG